MGHHLRCISRYKPASQTEIAGFSSQLQRFHSVLRFTEANFTCDHRVAARWSTVTAQRAAAHKLAPAVNVRHSWRDAVNLSDLTVRTSAAGRREQWWRRGGTVSRFSWFHCQLVTGPWTHRGCFIIFRCPRVKHPSETFCRLEPNKTVSTNVIMTLCHNNLTQSWRRRFNWTKHHHRARFCSRLTDIPDCELALYE